MYGHDFSIKYVADNVARATPGLYTFTAAWAALEGSILLWAMLLSVYVAVITWRFRDRARDPLVAWATLIQYAVLLFFFALMLFSANPFTRPAGDDPLRRRGPESAAAEPSARRDPPAVPLHGLRRLRDPVLVRARRADHGPLRRGLVGGRSAHDARLVGVPHDRHRARCVVELLGAGLGRLLGLGSGRERVAAAVAHRDGVHPLRHGAGTAGDVAGLEPVARTRDVLPHDPRHLPDPLGCHQLGARVLAVEHRSVAADLPRSVHVRERRR